VMPVGKRYFVDVAIPEGKRRKKHVVYHGEKVVKIDDLRKLPDAEEVYLDALFPKIFYEAKELLERGVKVYVLTSDAVALNMVSPKPTC